MTVEEKAAKDAADFQTKLLETVTNEIKSLKADVEAKVAEKIESEMKRLGMDKLKNAMDVEQSGFTPEQAAKRARQVKTGKFIKALRYGDLKEIAALSEKSMSEGTDSAGGYMVPVETMAEVDRIREDFGFIAKFARKLPMTRDTLNFPNVATAMTVSVPGEATAQTDGSPVLGNVVLAAKTIVGIAMISNELLEDANQDVASFVMDMAGEAIAGYEDSQGLTGTGSPYTGVFGDSTVTVVTQASTKTAFTDVTLDNLIDLTTSVKSGAIGNCKFVMHRTVFGAIRKILENSQHVVTFPNPMIGYAVQRDMQTPCGFIEGFPVYGNDKMPATSATAVSTKYIIFGNFDYFYYGDRKQMTMDVSDSATVSSVNAFASNQKAIRVTKRVALAVGVGAAFAVLKTAAS